MSTPASTHRYADTDAPEPAPASQEEEPYERLWARLPDRLRPLREEPRDRRRLHLLEGTALLLVALLLAIATVNDVVRNAGVNHRIVADLHTWRVYTHHDYKNVGTDQELLGPATKRDVVCGNTEPGPPKQRPQICLVMTGEVHDGLRTVAGGWYLPADAEDDVRPLRHGCFGAVTKGLCPR